MIIHWFLSNLEIILLTLFLGIISGIISALTFYLLLRKIKPNIKISTYIARYPITLDDGTIETEYCIKIINKSNHDLEDVSWQLFLMEDYFHGTGKNFTAKKIEFKSENSLMFLSGVKNKNKTHHDNCRQIRIKGNLEAEWDMKREWLFFQIVSYHSRSGSRKVHTQKYTNPAICIKNGMFDSGHTFDIITN